MSKGKKEPRASLLQAEEYKSDFGGTFSGLMRPDRLYWNLPTPALIEEAILRGEGHLLDGGPFVVNTGKWSARAAQEKVVVHEQSSQEYVWWGEHNRPMSIEKFSNLFNRLTAYWQGEELFIQDLYCGAEPEHRMAIRVITETAWHAHFSRNMLIAPEDPQEQKLFVPDFTLFHAPSFKVDTRVDGTRSDTVIAIDFARREAIICGTSYGGEIKKTLFTMMNYLLPFRGVLPMHCSANMGDDGAVALFFGLSGTGKTTLSADPHRQLIGDDEHGWGDCGVFNFEGGCYAKVIRLSEEHEPEIWSAAHRFGTILENVVWDLPSRLVDLEDDRFTENTRASYPLSFIKNALPAARSPNPPQDIILLTCDAQGVLPPIARLNPQEAIYHFISGYTSKIAGTEIGLGVEPQITFSACFGAPFMVHHPYTYGRMLAEKMERYGVRCWLVNTGWVGGRFGIGRRISIRHTRALLEAALEGKLEKQPYRQDKIFGFQVPESCPAVPDEVLQPKLSWDNERDYWKAYNGLATRFIENFKLFQDEVPVEVLSAGPRRREL